MASSTVIRVKRRLEDNPQDALVVMCKRIKTDAEESEEISPSLFVFCGTVDNQETIEVSNIVQKTDKNIQTKHNVSDIVEKIRKERKEVSTKSRYEVVNCSRGLKDGDNCKDVIDLVDILEKATDSDNVKYTYDIYTSACEGFNISAMDELVSVEHFDNLIYGSSRDNGRQSASSEDADDDDDSNDENNFRNDYPDTDVSSIDEDDMVRIMNKMDLECDLSSDTGEDKIYDEPPDLFNEDVKRYGEAYAKYKLRVVSEDSGGKPSIIQSTKIRDMEEGYKDDSDDGFYYGQDEDNDHFKNQYSTDSSDDLGPD